VPLLTGRWRYEQKTKGGGTYFRRVGGQRLQDRPKQSRGMYGTTTVQALTSTLRVSGSPVSGSCNVGSWTTVSLWWTAELLLSLVEGTTIVSVAGRRTRPSRPAPSSGTRTLVTVEAKGGAVPPGAPTVPGPPPPGAGLALAEAPALAPAAELSAKARFASRLTTAATFPVERPPKPRRQARSVDFGQ
jgi:hypothetical protein